MKLDFSAPQNFINRELSWLEFNRRVLEEAADPSQPLIERVKFLAIFSSNLDEFFEIRVAGLKQQVENGTTETGPDDLLPAAILEAIQKAAHEVTATQYALWHDKIVPGLKAERIAIHPPASLGDVERKWMAKYFHAEVFPILTPLAVDASHPFPQVVNKSHNFIVRARRPRSREPLYAIVQVPRGVPRLVRLPAKIEEGVERWDFVYLSDLIKHHIGELFQGLKIEGVHDFRVTRNSDLYIDDEEAVNLLHTLEQELIRARKGDVVRLELDESCPPEIVRMLMERFQLTLADIYKVKSPISMTHLEPLFANDAFARLKDRPFVPIFSQDLPRRASLFETLRQRDVLLHHPYHSFQPIVEMVECAARDPQVLAIKITLYRTSGDSPIIAALSEAAINGKQVTAIIEVKARFDEANNIKWAQQLEEAGAHVVYGVVGLKTHCKAMLVVRRDEDRLRQYVHLGTGNYNPKTARVYTDLSLLSCHKELAQEVAGFFNTVTGLVEYNSFKRLLVAPFDLASRVKGMIERERDLARAGKAGRIIVKVNALVDEELIVALYEASAAGVKIDLIVRGVCCLRPGIPKISENIRVISVIGRFLEHSRIYYFGNNGAHEIYLASADWMPRNLHRRVEIAFRVEDPKITAEILEDMLPAFLNDTVKARELQPDGTYLRLKTEKGKKPSQAQLHFRERAREQGSDGGISTAPLSLADLVPQLQPPLPDVVRAADTPLAPSPKMAVPEVPVVLAEPPAVKSSAPPKPPAPLADDKRKSSAVATAPAEKPSRPAVKVVAGT